jgi:hypothetical protein
VKFLGEDWVISEMSPPTTPLDNETGLVGGGSIKLAKETVSGILNPKGFLVIDNIKIQLDDLETQNDTTSAIISVLDANDNILKKDKISPGTTKELVINGQPYKVHVWKVAPEYTTGAQWADMSVFSNELQFMHGYSVDPDYSNNKFWRAYLGWKNKGGQATDTQPDHLRTLIIYSDDVSNLSSGGTNNLLVGDYLPLLQDPASIIFSNNGLSTTTADYSTLRFTLQSTDYFISSSTGPNGQVCQIKAPYVKVQSAQTQTTSAFCAPHSFDACDNSFLVATNGGACESTTFQPGALFIKESPISSNWVKVDYPNNPQYMVIGFPLAGATHGTIIYGKKGTINCIPEGPDYIFTIQEQAGVGLSNDFVNESFFGLVVGSTASFNIDVQNPSEFLCNFQMDHVRYKHASPANTPSIYTNKEEGFVTERGSVFTQMTDTLVEFNIAETLVYSQFYLVKK